MQDPGSLSSGNSTLLMIFVAIAAFALLAQAIAFIVIAVGAKKALTRGMTIAEEVRVKAMPLIQDAHQLIRDTTPKVKVITENLVETSHLVRGKAQEFGATAGDINSKTRLQAARVNDLVTSVLNSTTEVTETIQRGIKLPLREVSGVVNGLKAGLDVLVGRAKGFGSYTGRESREDGPGWR